MTLRPTIPAALLLAGLAAAPAFAEEVTVYTQPSTTYYYTTPSLAEIYTTPTTIEVVEERPQVIVTAPLLTRDQAITQDVVDTLASDPRLSGRIGVETRNRTVELSGRVATPGQVRMAERDAKSVPGVREVQSQLRSSVGGSY